MTERCPSTIADMPVDLSFGETTFKGLVSTDSTTLLGGDLSEDSVWIHALNMPDAQPRI
jgi:hypothetical protein